METIVDYEDDFEDDDGSPQGRASAGVGQQQAGAPPQQGQAGQLPSPGRQGQPSPGKRDVQFEKDWDMFRNWARRERGASDADVESCRGMFEQARRAFNEQASA